jgi:hypothetical protein
MRYRRQLAKKARQEMKGFLDIVRRGHKRLIGGIWFGRARHVIPMVAKRLRGDDQGRVGLPCILLGTVAKHVIRQVDSEHTNGAIRVYSHRYWRENTASYLSREQSQSAARWYPDTAPLGVAIRKENVWEGNKLFLKR